MPGSRRQAASERRRGGVAPAPGEAAQKANNRAPRAPPNRSERAVAKNGSPKDEPIIIKKYANRRLYNTATSSYVTLDHLCAMVKEGRDFQVVDAKTGEDITRSVLTQIIFEEESKGQNLLPIQFLRQLIRFYGDSMESFLPSYLEMSMEQFTRNQEQFRRTIANALGAAPPFRQYEEQIRQNMAMFERAIEMFSPFPTRVSKEAENTPPAEGTVTPSAGAQEPHEPESPNTQADELRQLKKQMAEMQAKLDALTKKS